MPGNSSVCTPGTPDTLPALLLCGHAPGERQGQGIQAQAAGPAWGQAPLWLSP